MLNFIRKTRLENGGFSLIPLKSGIKLGFAAIMVVAMLFTACGGDDDEVKITMIPIKGGTVSTAPAGQEDNGIFSNCTTEGTGVTMEVSSFYIANIETPYSVWYEVKQWAASKGYNFANDGREGSHGSDGADPTEGSRQPVTNINWRDAIIWCNAYSEKQGKTPVYYTDAEYKTPLRASTNNQSLSGTEDNPYIKADANGYRLPTEVQWEYAARGGNVDAAAWTYLWAGTNEESSLAEYAVYGDVHYVIGTKDVMSKKSNSTGLFDMSGNVFEWCFDWNGNVPSNSQTDYKGAESGSDRVTRGGSWLDTAQYLRSAHRYCFYPAIPRRHVGFRILQLQG